MLRTAICVLALSACTTSESHQASSLSAPGSVIARASGRCVDVSGASYADGTQIQIWDCNGTGAQQWTVPDAGQTGTITNATSGMCLDLSNDDPSDGTAIDLWDCNGTAAQQWTFEADGTIRNPGAGKCVNVWGNGHGVGTPLRLYDCISTSDQEFDVAAGPVIAYAGLPPGPVQLSGEVWVDTRAQICAVNRCDEDCWDEGSHEDYGCCAADRDCGWDDVSVVACTLSGTNPGQVTVTCPISFQVTYAGWDELDQTAYPIQAPAENFTVTGALAADGSFAFDPTSAGTTGDTPGNDWRVAGTIARGAYGGDIVLTVTDLRAGTYFGPYNGVLNLAPATTVLWPGTTCAGGCWPRGLSNPWGPGIDLTDWCQHIYGVDTALELTSQAGPAAWQCVTPSAVYPMSYSSLTTACAIEQQLDAVHQGDPSDPDSWYCAAE